jgi:lysophospholipase L1-like esterase
VTLGVGDLVPLGGEPGWAAHVAEVLDASVFVNLARLGARARTVPAEQLDRAVALRPHVALVSAGGNDVLRGDLDPAEVLASTRAAVQRLQDVGAEVVLLGVPAGGRVAVLPDRLRRVLEERVAVVNAALQGAADATGAALVAPPVGVEPMAWHVDRIHPGPAGHRRLAGAAADVLALRGFTRHRPVPPVLLEPPGRVAELGWLVRNGVPWAAKRSVDLAPALVRGVWRAPGTTPRPTVSGRRRAGTARAPSGPARPRTR